MADNQRAKHGDSQSGQNNDQKNDQENSNNQEGRPGPRKEEEGNRDSSFAQGGEGDQKQVQ